MRMIVKTSGSIIEEVEADTGKLGGRRPIGLCIVTIFTPDLEGVASDE